MRAEREGWQHPAPTAAPPPIRLPAVRRALRARQPPRRSGAGGPRHYQQSHGVGAACARAGRDRADTPEPPRGPRRYTPRRQRRNPAQEDSTTERFHPVEAFVATRRKDVARGAQRHHSLDSELGQAPHRARRRRLSRRLKLPVASVKVRIKMSAKLQNLSKNASMAPRWLTKATGS